MNKSTLIIVGVMLFVVLIGGIYILLLDESEKQKRNETPAAQALLVDSSEKAYLDMSQTPVDLSADFGNVIVVTAWASWCPQCAEDITRLDQVATEFEGREVTFLAINRAENPYTAERFLSTVTQPTRVRIILDPSDHFFATNAGYAMPETIVYDKDGNILFHQRGDIRHEELKNAIEQALE